MASLLNGGNNRSGHDASRSVQSGVPLIKMAKAIGKAVETEVVSQRRIKERYRATLSAAVLEESDDSINNIEEIDDENANDNNTSVDSTSTDQETEIVMDKWAFSASHLKLFWDDLKRMGMGKNKSSVRYAMRRAKQAMSSGDRWTDDDITHVGAALLSILMEQAMIEENGKKEPAFQIEKRWTKDGKKSVSFVTIHDRLHKIFLEDEYVSWAATTTRHMPMIVPPTKWTGARKGAYRWLEVNLMRTHGSNIQGEALRHADLSDVCDGLDILGKQAWKINNEILEIGQRCWRDNVSIGDIPSRTDFEVPPERSRPSFQFDTSANGQDPDYERKMADIQAYRDSVAKRQRIEQKNMVSMQDRPLSRPCEPVRFY
ncbi:MAG: hypothetical protein SGILL_002123 [Bacillariaceae sp.]